VKRRVTNDDERRESWLLRGRVQLEGNKKQLKKVTFIIPLRKTLIIFRAKARNRISSIESTTSTEGKVKTDKKKKIKNMTTLSQDHVTCFSYPEMEDANNVPPFSCKFVAEHGKP